MTPQPTIASYIEQLEKRKQEALDAARKRYDADVQAAQSVYRRAMQALTKLQQNPELLELFEELRSIQVDVASTTSIANGRNPDASHEAAAGFAAWPGLRQAIRQYASNHPKAITIAGLLKFCDSEYGPGCTDKKALVSELYKMSHGKSAELAVVTRASKKKDGVWRAKENLKKIIVALPTLGQSGATHPQHPEEVKRNGSEPVHSLRAS